MEELTGKVAKIYEELQTLGIQPTKNNVRILNSAYLVLEEVYRYLNEVNHNAESND